VCPYSREGQLHATLARVPEKVEGVVSFSPLSCGALCALLGSPAPERCGHAGASPGEAIKMVKGLKHMMHKRRLG